VTDLFEEVEEQLRSDRYRELARKFLPWMVGLAALALVVTLAYWGYDYWRRQTIAKASESYTAAIEAMQGQDEAKARKLWTEVSKSQAGAYKALSLMHLAAFALQEKKVPEAVRLFDEAAKAAPDPLVGDVARLKSAFALMDTASLKDMEGRLTPLMAEGRPYRLQAREALAFARLQAGDTAGARGEFLLIQQALGAPESLQQRAQAAVALIDSGSAKALPAVVKAALAMPPPMMIPPGATITAPPGMPQPGAGAPQ
jgi:hypothetical protein